MRIRYEEKVFEGYFNIELANLSKVYYPLGQFQEGSIGTDAVALTRNRHFWRRLGHPYFFRMKYSGLDFREIAAEMEDFLGKEVANIPDIKTNLLFQYKRSEYIVSARAAEWTHWKSPYFRYDIYPEQQSLLEHLHSKFQQSALILYAAPALQDVNELVDYHCNRKIISHTNFRPAADLSGHARNTFKVAGTHSVACSEPVRHEYFDLLAELRERKAGEQPAFESIVALAKGFSEVIRQTSLAKPFATLVEQYGLSENEQSMPLLSAHITMAVVKDLTGIQWLISTSS
ncbi:hypothetical protein [Glaciimonas sp. PAMC28666]|uniref:hypothetical protein n=1 Tax=Glaciimonas sp. PAMC28666 TaxID=2807626 RepID=UPI001963BF66|nr:hypothetical protein [Glaciimonas sp. PAMC28666]QRX82236.1 hypothetical protein JQN73_19420 [Glaciimonas sp. PAMC28666]